MTIILNPRATKQQKMQYRADWMLEFSNEVIRLQPKHSGRIDWNTAQYLFNTGAKAIDAAVQYAANHIEPIVGNQR